MEKQKNSWVLIPIFGTLIFVVHYLVAAFLYPGGSQIDKNSVGFSWTDNYWCNLLNDYAINGQPNPARPIAMSGLFVLCLALSFFWFQFPNHISVGKFAKPAIQISVILAMTTALFLFTDIDHDLITNLASFFGLIATFGTFVGLYKTKWYGLFAFGLLIVFLVGLNNYVYYSKGLIVYLPVIQKISFATFLLWICFIDINLYRKRNI